MRTIPWLSLLTVLPLLGALIVLVIPDERRNLIRRIAFCFSFSAIAIVVLLLCHFDRSSSCLQFQELHPWISAVGVEYHLGIDGLGMLMVILTSVVVPIGLAASSEIEERVSLYHFLVLLLQACLFGTFTALNFFHWFIFWELGLIPAFFLIKLWGGPGRTKAATQFLIYTMVGSVAMLLAFLSIFLGTGKFDLIDLAVLAQKGELIPAVATKVAYHQLTPDHLALLLFAGVFLGFAVKVPLVPFHTWLPSAYAEAPSGTTVLLTGAMSKMGLYGFLRILLPIFAPQMHQLGKPLLWLSVATIVLSAYSALVQKDLKRVFAYSSINHLGYCLLALFAVVASSSTDHALMNEKYAAMDGAFLQILNHAITAATLFWFVALLEKRSGGRRGLDDFGGLRKAVPVFTGLMGIALFSSLGLPGLNGFVGEFLIFKGSFPLTSWATSIAILGLLATVLFVLGILQRVFSGSLNQRWVGLPDLTTRERVALAFPVGLMFLLGVYPQLVLGTINSTVIGLVQHLKF